MNPLDVIRHRLKTTKQVCRQFRCLFNCMETLCHCRRVILLNVPAMFVSTERCRNHCSMQSSMLRSAIRVFARSFGRPSAPQRCRHRQRHQLFSADRQTYSSHNPYMTSIRQKARQAVCLPPPSPRWTIQQTHLHGQC